MMQKQDASNLAGSIQQKFKKQGCPSNQYQQQHHNQHHSSNTDFTYSSMTTLSSPQAPLISETIKSGDEHQSNEHPNDSDSIMEPTEDNNAGIAQYQSYHHQYLTSSSPASQAQDACVDKKEKSQIQSTLLHPASKATISATIGTSAMSDVVNDQSPNDVYGKQSGSGQHQAVDNLTTQAAVDITQPEQPQIVKAGHFLQMIAQQGDIIACSNAFITPFHSHEVPNINILLYYVVVSHNAGLHDSQAPCVLLLLERLCQTAAHKGHPIFINSFTIHRLILVTVLVASKMYNDTYYSNSFIAQVGGVSLDNINQLEGYFMNMIDWNVNISTEEFEFYENSLSVAYRQQEQILMKQEIQHQQSSMLTGIYQNESNIYYQINSQNDCKAANDKVE